MLTGFSAGGNLCFTAPLRHYRESKEEFTDLVAEDGKITGIIAFYPPGNQKIARKQKAESNPTVKGPEPLLFYDIIDKSYYRDLPPNGWASLDLSPALAPMEALQNSLPARITIFTCERDKVLMEGKDFRKKLIDLDKTVGGRMMVGKGHGFDKLERSARKTEIECIRRLSSRSRI